MPQFIRLEFDELGDPILVFESVAESDLEVYNGVLQAAVGNDHTNSEYEFEIEIFVEESLSTSLSTFFEVKAEKKSEEEVNVGPQPVAKIKSIDFHGRIEISFSQTLDLGKMMEMLT